MPRHRIPLAIAELTGRTRHDPQRYKQPPKVEPLGDPPEHLSSEARAVWVELAEGCVPGVLGAPDRFVLELASTLTAEMRRSPGNFSTGKMTALRSILARLVGSGQ